MDTHVFNENKKRLEPIDKTCVFCGKGISESQDDNLFIPLFKESDRLNVIVYRKVSYKRLDMGLSRCPHCKEIHIKQTKMTWIYTIIVGILTAVVSFWLTKGFFDDFTIIMAILIGVIFACIAFFASRILLEKRHARKEGILTKEDASIQYDIVRALLADGWTFDQPTA